MTDMADPLDGWSQTDVLQTSSGPASADIYGKLYYMVRALLKSFLGRISGLDISFRYYRLDAIDLPEYLEKKTYSRVEVRIRSRRVAIDRHMAWHTKPAAALAALKYN